MNNLSIDNVYQSTFSFYSCDKEIALNENLGHLHASMMVQAKVNQS